MNLRVNHKRVIKSPEQQNTALHKEMVNKRMMERGHWASRTEFFLAVAGDIVGLGNVWRFPYLCYRNGGGVFLVPYLLFAVTCGLPLFLLETAMGQYTQEGSITCWHSICPVAEGLGYASLLIELFGCLYYILILAWAFFYFILSFKSQLPWTTCDNSWNTDKCVVIGDNLNWTRQTNSTLAATEFWERRVLSLSKGIEEMGAVNWEILLCLIAMWIICYFSIWKGVKTTGKVVYFTAILPYVMLLVLLIRGLTLPGALKGIVFYLYPDFQQLTKPQVWMEAASQITFSYSIGAGILTVLGSYNPYNSNCYRDCFWLCLLNSTTSIVAGFAVFSVLGFMAHVQGVPIEDVTESGPGLAFIAYPQAVAMMPLSQLWAVCFFLMVILLGLDTQFLAVEVIVTSVTDLFPQVLRKTGRREIFLLLFCLFCFVCQFVMVTEGGIYVFHLIDYYACNGACIVLVAVFESLAVSWIFGNKKMCDAIEDMTGSYPNIIFRLCWKYITPLLLLVCCIYFVVGYQPLTLNNRYVYPSWANGIGLMMALSSVLLVPGWALGLLWRAKGSFKERWCLICSPDCNLRVPQKQKVTMCLMSSSV